ncbi:carbonic anhydrase [Allopontixanthobacter sediminis]|nr:carbonic anhydrase [Allopontixanthobacter sediminis]
MQNHRRDFLKTAAFGGVAIAGAGSAALAAAPDVPPGTGMVPPAPPGMTPDQALALLEQGNAAFLRGDNRADLSNAQRRLELAKGQSPFAAYVTCSDSRVPPELLFGRGLGELFIIRNAGNTVDTVALGSIEYAVAVLKVPLVVVMGHERCGAVEAATKVVTENATYPGQIGRMIEPIIPAVLKVRDDEGDLLDNSVRSNVRRVAGYLREQTDPLLQEPLATGALKVIGAYYDLDTGKVDFFDRA